MALVRVRTKKPENAPSDWKAEETEVSEDWLARWPEDFDRIPEEELAAEQQAAQKAAVEAAAPVQSEQQADGESRRSSFR